MSSTPPGAPRVWRLPALLPPDEARTGLFYLKTLEHYPGRLEPDDQVPGSRGIYGDPLFDALLARFCGRVAEAVDRRLFPTYSYVRIYPRGAVLAPHTDRDECEYTLSVTIGTAAATPWALHVSSPDSLHESITTEVGDGAVFQGIDNEHWRDPLEADWAVQAFFHYVDADGPYAHLKNDSRPALGLPASYKNQTV